MSILTEYDEEKLLRVIEEQTREDLNDLIVWLLKQGRQEELIQSASDAELQKRLIAEMRSEMDTGKEGKQ